jgi:hypothetical protein
LYDNLNHYTQFTGFMLEEEIVASLWEICFNSKKWSSTQWTFNHDLTVSVKWHKEYTIKYSSGYL